MSSISNVCAQEMLSGLYDHQEQFKTLISKLNLNERKIYNYDNELEPLENIYVALDSKKDDTREITDGLSKGLDILNREAEERTLLATAKVVAKSMVSEKEMTTSQMEHLRKLIPKYLEFLRNYVSMIKSGEKMVRSKMSEVKIEGNEMARETLSTLGNNKKASEAHAFLKSIQDGHMRDNTYTLVTQDNAESRIYAKMEELQDLSGQLDAAKTNANSSLVMPFPEPLKIRVPEEGEAKKTVQQILCESTPGPASLYSKLDKLAKGLCLSHNMGPGKYVVAGMKGPGLSKPILPRFDILQRYNDWFMLLIKYKTAMDRYNLTITFKCGDGKLRTMTEELIRVSQTEKLESILNCCDTQIKACKKSVKTNNAKVEDFISLKKSNLKRKHKKEDDELYESLYDVESDEDDDEEEIITKQSLNVEDYISLKKSNLKRKHKKEDDELDESLYDVESVEDDEEEDIITKQFQKSLNEIKIKKLQEKQVKETEKLNNEIKLKKLEEKHSKETEELNSELDKYYKQNWMTYKVVPGLKEKIIQIRKDLHENKRVNARRRAPANATTWVACKDI
uniref:Uncharacterized protein n=1 Tax=Mimiviridae sp. ChoanoV1 TaxID=2596887 RepID=A0A5B8IDQ8_9VIRU|nr:hypothetical protein 1_301 [Mimiviridae sp. ChoanoV1]